MYTRRKFIGTVAASTALSAPFIARAAYPPGVTDTEIKIGQTCAYSGPASAFGVIGRTYVACIRELNDNGGINGRRINFISLDDSYSPPRTVELTRRLVEEDVVAFLYAGTGTACMLAVRPYLNENRIPQLFVVTGADELADPAHYPWTIPANPSYRIEGRIYAKHILATLPGAQIGVLYQNDGFGRDYLSGLRDILGPAREGMIVKQTSYEVNEPSVDSQVIALQASGANTLVLATAAKFGPLALRKAFDISWTPARYLSYTAAAIPLLKTGGLEKAKGAYTALVGVDPKDPSQSDLADVKRWRNFAAKYLPSTEADNGFAAASWSWFSILKQTLQQCRADLSRENILAQAANLNFVPPLSLPGVEFNTSPSNFRGFSKMAINVFDGEHWVRSGDVIAG
jgi:branched-chain amino acid transport system substrate-binding protein